MHKKLMLVISFLTVFSMTAMDRAQANCDEKKKAEPTLSELLREKCLVTLRACAAHEDRELAQMQYCQLLEEGTFGDLPGQEDGALYNVFMGEVTEIITQNQHELKRNVALADIRAQLIGVLKARKYKDRATQQQAAPNQAQAAAAYHDHPAARAQRQEPITVRSQLPVLESWHLVGEYIGEPGEDELDVPEAIIFSQDVLERCATLDTRAQLESAFGQLLIDQPKYQNIPDLNGLFKTFEAQVSRAMQEQAYVASYYSPVAAARMQQQAPTEQGPQPKPEMKDNK